MRAIKPGTKIVIMCNEVPEIQFRAVVVVRAHVLRGGRGCVRFRVDPRDFTQVRRGPPEGNRTKFVASTVPLAKEGTHWARGWDTEAARALCAAAALM